MLKEADWFPTDKFSSNLPGFFSNALAYSFVDELGFCLRLRNTELIVLKSLIKDNEDHDKEI